MSILIFCLLLLITSAAAGPAASCTSGSDPCCNMGLTQSIQWTAMNTGLDSCASLGQPCPICGQHNAQDTSAAASTQSQIDSFVNFFDQNKCWQGYIASSPGNDVEYLEHKTFICFVESASCKMNDYIDFAYQCTGNASHLSVSLIWCIVSAILLFSFF